LPRSSFVGGVAAIARLVSTSPFIPEPAMPLVERGMGPFFSFFSGKSRLLLFLLSQASPSPRIKLGFLFSLFQGSRALPSPPLLAKLELTPAFQDKIGFFPSPPFPPPSLSKPETCAMNIPLPSFPRVFGRKTLSLLTLHWSGFLLFFSFLTDHGYVALPFSFPFSLLLPNIRKIPLFFPFFLHNGGLPSRPSSFVFGAPTTALLRAVNKRSPFPSSFPLLVPIL